MNQNISLNVYGISVSLFELAPANNSEMKIRLLNLVLIECIKQMLKEICVQGFYRYRYRLVCTRKMHVALVQRSTKMFLTHFLFRIKRAPTNHSFLVYNCVCVVKGKNDNFTCNLQKSYFIKIICILDLRYTRIVVCVV